MSTSSHYTKGYQCKVCKDITLYWHSGVCPSCGEPNEDCVVRVTTVRYQRYFLWLFPYTETRTSYARRDDTSVPQLVDGSASEAEC